MKIKKGIDLPISGKPIQEIIPALRTTTFALRGLVDFMGLKPSMKVAVGDTVKVGQPLYQHKENTSVVFPAPVSGKVIAINRGAKRVLESVVIQSDGKNTPFNKFSAITKETSAQNILDMIVSSGHFIGFKTRPFNKVPDPAVKPDAIFVTAMDTNPLAVDASVVIQDSKDTFKAGVDAIAKLTDGKTFVCASPSTALPEFSAKTTEIHTFEGKHPAGNAGTHIHFLRPVSATKMVWSINYQYVINIGTLVLTGKVAYDKVISLAGPAMTNPRLVQTTMGANIAELIGNDAQGVVRVINGSILTGDTAMDTLNFVGATTTQVSILSGETDSRGLGWLIPWRDKFSSVFNVHFSSLYRKKPQAMDVGVNGSFRAIIPIGHFETLTPLDILPTQLMRSIIVGDTDQAQKLGLLELAEEDIALFAFADIGKNDFIGALQDCLAKVEKEG